MGNQIKVGNLIKNGFKAVKWTTNALITKGFNKIYYICFELAKNFDACALKNLQKNNLELVYTSLSAHAK